MNSFICFPAIDLRHGQVVRLQLGDPSRLTQYSDQPHEVARQWLAAGAPWLHIVNLDGAFEEPDSANQKALVSILNVATEFGAQVQFGGGLRTFDAVQRVIDLGVSRAILGTAAVQSPAVLRQSLQAFGPESIAVSLDAQNGLVRIRGWQEGSNLSALALAKELAAGGLQWLVYTDVGRDGIGTGLNLNATLELARASGLRVIASGGVRNMDDIEMARAGRLAGVIIGRALYEGWVTISRWQMEEEGTDN